MILTGEIKPGELLSQVKLAREFGVSTTPLREAMRQLQGEGLLISEPNRRARVAALDVQNLDAVYAERILLEALGIALSVPLFTDADLERLQTLQTTMTASAATEDLDPWNRAHSEFHELLVRHASEPLTQTIRLFSERGERYRKMSVLGDSPRGWTAAAAEHQSIIDAVIERAAHRAAGELARHLARTAITIVAHLSPEGDARATRTAVQMVSSWNRDEQPLQSLVAPRD